MAKLWSHYTTLPTQARKKIQDCMLGTCELRKPAMPEGLPILAHGLLFLLMMLLLLMMMMMMVMVVVMSCAQHGF